EQRLPSMSDEMAVGREGYVFFLHNVALMPFAPEELLALGAREWERSIAFEAYAQERARNEPALTIGPDQTTQRLVEENAENDIRHFLEEHNILSVPEWIQHYRNMPVPGYITPLAEFGVLDDLTSANRLDDNGVRYIPKPSSDLGYFELSAALDPRP